MIHSLARSLAALGMACLPGAAGAHEVDPIPMAATATPGNVVPEDGAPSPVGSLASASVTLAYDTLDPALSYQIQLSGLDLATQVEGIRFRVGAPGSNGDHVLNVYGALRQDDADLVVDLPAGSLSGVWDDADENFGGDGQRDPEDSVALSAVLAELLAESIYIEVTTHAFPLPDTAELRGQVEFVGAPPGCNPVGPFGLPGLGDPPDQIGQWAPVQPWPTGIIHATLLPTGKVLTWAFTNLGSLALDPILFDPVTETIEYTPFPGDSEIFCAGHSLLPDGRVIVVGGTEPIGTDNVRTHVFDPASGTWARVADMALDRYYPNVVSLPDGRALAVSGEDINLGQLQKVAEVYDPEADTWTQLPGQDVPSLGALPSYAFDFVIPDGRVFYAGGGPNTQFIDVAADTRYLFEIVPFTSSSGSAVAYGPGRIMRLGGNSGSIQTAHPRTAVVDLTEPTPHWRETAAANWSRAWHNLVVLPDGTVLAVGGATDYGITGSGWDADCSVHAAELWNPITETWTVMASMERSHMYHSTALLLPDGRVFAGGGENDQGDETNYELFSPPYLFRGPRPTLTDAPAGITYGQPFSVTSPESPSIARVALTRLGSVTHGFDQNQRYVPLAFQPGSAGELLVSAPPDANHAPPGDYMLWLVDASGVPSHAEFVRLSEVTVCTWLGGDGAWSDSAQWDCDPLVPDNGGGTATFDVVVDAGAVTLDIDPEIRQLSLAGGSISGPGDLTAGAALTWTGGSMGGTGTTRAEGGLAIAGTALKSLSGSRTLVNAAGQAATWSDGSIELGSEGARLVNEPGATFSVTGGAPGRELRDACGVGCTTPGAFLNQGSFHLDLAAGSDLLTVDIGAFENSGTLSLDRGTLQSARAYTQTAGVTRLNGGALGPSAVLDIQDGVLEGDGAIDAPVHLGGELSPGASPGRLTITGPLIFGASGRLTAELAGLSPGDEYDLVQGAADLTLAGTIAVELVAGFEATISNADVFTLVETSGPGTAGAFDNAASGARLLIAGGGSFLVSYDGESPSVLLSDFRPFDPLFGLELSGAAAGGAVAFRIQGVGLQVATLPGQTAEEVAQAVADAINGEPALAALGISAVREQATVRTNAALTDTAVTDPGLDYGVISPALVPALPEAGYAALAGLLLLAAARLLAPSRSPERRIRRRAPSSARFERRHSRW